MLMNLQLMQAMGLLKSSDLIAWMITTLLEICIILILCIIIMYSGGILETTSVPFVFTFLFVFGLGVLAFW